MSTFLFPQIDAFLQPQGMIFEPEYPPEETIDVSVADVRRDQLTLHLAEGSTWFKVCVGCK